MGSEIWQIDRKGRRIVLGGVASQRLRLCNTDLSTCKIVSSCAQQYLGSERLSQMAYYTYSTSVRIIMEQL